MLELTGTGLSPADVLAVARAAGLGRPVLVGHSLGALIGLACAARAGAIRALVMVDPAPITNERAKAFFREGSAGQWRKLLTPEQVAKMVAVHRTQMARFGYLPEGY